MGTSRTQVSRDGVRWLHRTERSSAGAAAEVPDAVALRRCDPPCHHTVIPEVVADAFGSLRWPEDWDRFPAFDPGGVFVAEAAETCEASGSVVGFVIVHTYRNEAGPTGLPMAGEGGAA